MLWILLITSSRKVPAISSSSWMAASSTRATMPYISRARR
ncbi:Uncharacterised protein [Bordetella pertussis]|nr:Uncharacterised protein [Bordetella pertussis]CPN00730.1 Uncharacterised protein [Bordetella pertussis]